MKRKNIIATLVIMLIIASIGMTSAFGGHSFGMDSKSRDAIRNAIDANDFSTWKEAISAQLTEENFGKFVERRAARTSNHNKSLADLDPETLAQLQQAKLDGDFEKAKELREQLGLAGKFGKHQMSGHFARGIRN